MASAETSKRFKRLIEITQSLPNYGLVIGPTFALAAFLLTSNHLPSPQPLVLAVGVLMAVWWILETLPLAVTALVPILAFPILGVSPTSRVTSSYGHPLIFLFLGGFLLALALQKCQLHRRIALIILSRSGSSAAGIVAGFMAATAFLSMWVSNSATAIMMLPIALSTIDLFRSRRHDLEPEQLKAERNFSLALLLGIAYAANIGGVGTLIGSPPNALLAAFLKDSGGPELSFASWLVIGLPIVLLMLPISWLILTRVLYSLNGMDFSSSQSLIKKELKSLGAFSLAEKKVAFVFCLTASLWIFHPLLGLLVPSFQTDDTMIAIGAGILLFAIPVNWNNREFILSWTDATQVPWGLLLLFGGGLSLAAAIQDSGLSLSIGGMLALAADLPVWLIIVGVTLLIISLTEVTSNTATAASFLPVILSLAASIGQPVMILAVPAVIAASFAFMLPVATPPNAIVYAGGHVKIKEMVRAGLWHNFAGTLVIVLVTLSIVKLIYHK